MLRSLLPQGHFWVAITQTGMYPDGWIKNQPKGCANGR